GYKIMYDEVPPGTKPFDEANKLVFATGPLTGPQLKQEYQDEAYRLILNGHFTSALMTVSIACFSSSLR
ncbi:aldehyde ferredoxin oxidoreductase N-terminal domain-containing protein, partial [Escherichia coli]